MVKVKNRNGTSGECKNCGPWRDHWDRFSKNQLFKDLDCSNSTCDTGEKAEHGAHVKKCGSVDNKTYIVPLCNTCNQLSSDKCFDVPESLLIDVNGCKGKSLKEILENLK